MTINTIEILKVKLDWHKTFMTSSMVLTVTSVIAFNTIPSAEGKWAFSIGAAGFFIVFLVTSYYYDKRHRELINELRK